MPNALQLEDSATALVSSSSINGAFSLTGADKQGDCKATRKEDKCCGVGVGVACFGKVQVLVKCSKGVNNFCHNVSNGTSTSLQSSNICWWVLGVTNYNCQ